MMKKRKLSKLAVVGTAFSMRGVRASGRCHQFRDHVQDRPSPGHPYGKGPWEAP